MRLPLLCSLLVLGAALVPALPAMADIVSYAIVQDDGSLRVQGKTIRLFGIYLPPTGRGCVTRAAPPRFLPGSRLNRLPGARLNPPLCGSRAVRALQLKIQGFVRCQPVAQLPDRSISAICYVEEGSILDPPLDLGAWLIEQGWAVALPDAPFEYSVLERIARVNRRGVWGFQVDEIR